MKLESNKIYTLNGWITVIDKDVKLNNINARFINRRNQKLDQYQVLEFRILDLNQIWQDLQKDTDYDQEYISDCMEILSDQSQGRLTFQKPFKIKNDIDNLLVICTACTDEDIETKNYLDVISIKTKDEL